MTKKRWLIFIFILVAGILFLLLGPGTKEETGEPGLNANRGTITFEITPEFALPSTLLDSNGRAIATINNKSYSARVPLGKASYVVRSEGFQDFLFEAETYEEVSVKKEVALVLKTGGIHASILDNTSNLDSGGINMDNGYWIKNIDYYENNLWATGDLVVSREINDGEKVVAFNNGGKWDIVYAGTGYDEISLRSSGVPESVIVEVVR